MDALGKFGALKKLELLSAAPRATLTYSSCSPNFPRAYITYVGNMKKFLNLPYDRKNDHKIFKKGNLNCWTIIIPIMFLIK